MTKDTTDWRLIETAPAGEDVILYSPDADPEILVGHRFRVGDDEDWYPQHESYKNGMPFDVGFTHWMPLPEPPARRS